MLTIVAMLLQTAPVLPGQDPASRVYADQPPAAPATTGPAGGMAPEGRTETDDPASPAASRSYRAFRPPPPPPPAPPPALGFSVSTGTTRAVSYLVLHDSYQPSSSGTLHALAAGGNEIDGCGDPSGCFVRFRLTSGMQNVRAIPGHRYRFQVDRRGRFGLFDLG